MYDYMKALQKHFDRQSHPELDAQIKSAREGLRDGIDAEAAENCFGCWTHRTRCWLKPR